MEVGVKVRVNIHRLDTQTDRQTDRQTISDNCFIGNQIYSRCSTLFNTCLRITVTVTVTIRGQGQGQGQGQGPS
jgi:hypothetical protein